MRAAVMFLLMCQPAVACPSCTVLTLQRAFPVLMPWLVAIWVWLVIHESLRIQGMSLVDCVIIGVIPFPLSGLGYPALLLPLIPLGWWCHYGISNYRALRKQEWLPDERKRHQLNHLTAGILVLIYLLSPPGLIYAF